MNSTEDDNFTNAISTLKDISLKWMFSMKTINTMQIHQLLFKSKFPLTEVVNVNSDSVMVLESLMFEIEWIIMKKVLNRLYFEYHGGGYNYSILNLSLSSIHFKLLKKTKAQEYPMAWTTNMLSQAADRFHIKGVILRNYPQ